MDLITSRAVVGAMKKAMEEATPPQWVNDVANVFQSDQAMESYPWLTGNSGLREWIGGRNAKGFSEKLIEIRNRHFEKAIVVQKRDLRRDKFGMIQMRVGEMAGLANEHPAELLSQLILNGESDLCYDGQYFFDTDHVEGDSGTQSNSISVDISALPTDKHGTITVPSVEEFQLAVGTGIQNILGLKNDAGRPVNQSARRFKVMVPPSYWLTANQALWTPNQVASSQTALSELNRKFSIDVEVNPYLSAWTTKFGIFRTDSAAKPLIFQRETAYNLSAKAEGSDYEHDNDAHEYGVDYWGNVSYGLWYHACLVTLA